MKPVKHIIISGAFGTGFYLLTRSFSASVICFLSGFLLDVDHVVDYYLEKKKILIRPKEIYLRCVEGRFKRFYLFFHSYELVLLLWLAILLFKLNIYFVAVTLGITQHLIFDQIGNRAFLNPLIYFTSYRISKGFIAESLLKKERIYE